MKKTILQAFILLSLAAGIYLLVSRVNWMKLFRIEKMTDALNFTQDLRNVYQRRFVTMVSENPDCTNLLGVSEANTDYNWKKRRT